MKNWEVFNEITKASESLEEQAIKLYSHELITAIEHLATDGDLVSGLDRIDMCQLYRGCHNWLNSEKK